MSENLKKRLVLACCATMALAFVGCGDDGPGTSSDSRKECGDTVCTEQQECVDGVCKDKVDDPCAKCTSDQTCEDGVCKDKVDDPCAKCTSDQTCEAGVCKDKVDPCAKCTADQKCENGVCKDLCGGEVCADGMICNNDKCEVPENPCDACTDKQECINFSCVDIDPCANKTCPDNQRCDRENDGACVDIDPCEGITCGAAQTCIKARCIDDACIVDGAEKNCGDGKTCAKGECVDDGCQDKTCDDGWQCIKGLCEETACIDYFCDEGRTCKGGKCVDNECLDMTCNEGQICSKGNCTYEACLNIDPCTVGKSCNAEGQCVFVTPPAISLDEPEDKASDESGKTVSLALHLNNSPTAEVRISCEVITESPNKEVEAACEGITFNADNWQHEQTIVITGVDDYLKDGDQVYKVKITTASDDADFNELTTESVELTNVDTTKPGFIFSETSLTTYEDQEQEAAKFTIRLSAIPASDVRLTLSTSNADEGAVSPDSITFTKDNWSEAQTISVKGKDDEIRDGNVNYTVFFAPSESNDEDYNGLTPSPIKVTNIDNDVAGINANIPAEDFVLQEGEDRVVVVKLNTQPKKDVNVALAVDDKTEAMFEAEKITLNAENWRTGVEVKLSGVADHVIDGDQPIKVSFKASSDDEDYNLEPIEFAGKVKDIDVADLVAMMGDAAIVKEGSSDFVTMSVSLSSKPSKNVTVALSVADETELKINKQTLTFTPDHWDMPQDVLVNSVDDDIKDGNIKSNVVMKMTSGDANFNKTKEIEFTTVDDDVAGFLINSNAASFPEGSGSTTSMKVSLLSQPTADVTVAVSSTDASELQVTSATSLTFTTKNWKTPQDVTVKVVDDSIADGTQTAQVKFVGDSSDTNFKGITGFSAIYTITDDDAPSVALSTQEQTISQAYPSTVASVVLGVQPSANVTVTLSSDSNAVTFSKNPLTFTTENWGTPQTVTINADFAAIAQAAATATITAKAAGTSYNVSSNNVVLNLVKVPEVQNFEYTGKVQSVTLPAGRFKLEAWGAQGGTDPAQSTEGGHGGYSTGVVTLTKSTTLYIYVGGMGGNKDMSRSSWRSTGGGGATDFALRGTVDSEEWKTDEHLYSRILVAGGGAGMHGSTGGSPSSYDDAGTDSRAAATFNRITGSYGSGSWYSPTINEAGYSIYHSGTTTYGVFGYAINHPHSNSTSYAGWNGATEGMDSWAAGGSGGGWYGGVTDWPNGSGGSGYAWCSAYASYYPDGCLVGQEYYLENVTLSSGVQTFNGPTGVQEKGHTGHGYARVTLVK